MLALPYWAALTHSLYSSWLSPRNYVIMALWLLGLYIFLRISEYFATFQHKYHSKYTRKIMFNINKTYEGENSTVFIQFTTECLHPEKSFVLFIINFHGHYKAFWNERPDLIIIIPRPSWNWGLKSLEIIIQSIFIFSVFVIFFYLLLIYKVIRYHTEEVVE